MATIKNDRLIAIGIFDFVIEALKKEGFDNFLFFASKTDGCSIEKIVSSRDYLKYICFYLIDKIKEGRVVEIAIPKGNKIEPELIINEVVKKIRDSLKTEFPEMFDKKEPE